MDPIVSVLIVSFNAEKFISQAINSFLDQSFSLKELIVVDGASTDGTIEILKNTNNPLVHWTSEPDKGIYDAMNKGISRSSGEWLYFLGADDRFYDNKVLENVFRQQENADIDFLYGDVYSVQLQKNYDGPYSRDKILFSNLCHQSIFYRKVLFDKIGTYNTEYSLFADWDMNIRTFLHPDMKTKYVPITIAVYGATGLSTLNKDLKFLRERLFPINLREFNEGAKKYKWNIKYYDRWWRLIRSLRLNETSINLIDIAQKQSIPPMVRSMYHFQKKIPSKIIFTGIFSKAFMTISYLYSLITGKLKSLK